MAAEEAVVAVRLGPRRVFVTVSEVPAVVGCITPILRSYLVLLAAEIAAQAEVDTSVVVM